MDFEQAVEILEQKFNQYVSYRDAHPEFTNPPAFVLALGTASGPNFLNQVVDCMLGGVQKPDGSFGLEPYSPERYTQKCVWFCMAMDEGYAERDLYVQKYLKTSSHFFTSEYKVDKNLHLKMIEDEFKKGKMIIHGLKHLSLDLRISLLRTLKEKREKQIADVLSLIKEPFTIFPVSYGNIEYTDYIYTDGKGYAGSTTIPIYTGGWEAYQSQEIPNFYNVITVPENYKQTSLNNLSRTKHIALRKIPLNTTEPMKNIVIGENCTLTNSPMLQLQTICEKIIEMGGFCFVYNDAFEYIRHGRRFNQVLQKDVHFSYLSNYYFEDMCDIPMFFQQFPNDRVFRIGGRDDKIITPLLSSIPTDKPLKKYNEFYRSSHYGGRSKRRTRKNRKSRKRSN